MMRLWVVLAALSFAGSASAENVLMKSNGLGLAAVGMVGATAAGMALAPPPQWQGFPKGEDGPHFQDEATGRIQGDCTARDGATVAKALKGERQPEAEKPQDGQIRLTDTGRKSDSQIFDSKAIYGAGQSITCPSQ